MKSPLDSEPVVWPEATGQLGDMGILEQEWHLVFLVSQPEHWHGNTKGRAAKSCCCSGTLSEPAVITMLNKQLKICW